MQKHRKPPKPSHYHTAVKGQCRYCGEDILKEGKINKRANWHPACVKEYRLIYFPQDTRKAVFRRDRGICEICGIDSRQVGWEMDHRKPLIEANGDIEYWKLANCRTLCIPCHTAKTSEEATERARKRRLKSDD